MTELDRAGEQIAEGTALTPREAVAILNNMADGDPRLANAWAARKSNPAAWTGIIKALNADLQKRFQSPGDAAVTEDVAAVSAAVRGAQPQTPGNTTPADRLGHLSNAEFTKHVVEKFGVTPPV
jgi:hypothetical protein